MKDFKIYSCTRSFSIECGNDKLIVEIDFTNFMQSKFIYVDVYNIYDVNKKFSFKFKKEYVDDVLDIAIKTYYNIYDYV